jgi:hypothetical protein
MKFNSSFKDFENVAIVFGHSSHLQFPLTCLAAGLPAKLILQFLNWQRSIRRRIGITSAAKSSSRRLSPIQ